MLWIVTKYKIEKKCSEEVSTEDVGQKAYGLCQMPEAWTLPFFVIDRFFFMEFCNKKQNHTILDLYLKNIFETIRILSLGDNLIIRSSGIQEGMTERGKYESLETTIQELPERLYELVDRLKGYEGLQEEGMPFIIQMWKKSSVSGHMSNERRFAKENRDFIVEYKDENGEVITQKISLRNWRKTYDLELYKKKPLSLKGGKLADALKVSGAFYYEMFKKKRVHLEFICCRDEVYLVQCDFDVPYREVENPDDYDIEMTKCKEFHPQILRRIREDDKGKYHKIDNVFLYREVGEKFPPLFLLDDKNALEELRKGYVNKKLSADLQVMAEESLVIRTNITSSDLKRSQLSKRSNELRDGKDAERFLIETSRLLVKDGIDEYIFILHNFIPAKIAAFVNAKPMERIVEIQTLWGLPEGLYYNAHDRIIVNTREINACKMNRDRFQIKFDVVYKENFIAPDQDGKWVVKKLKPPYDWQCTITDKKIIGDIAYRARKIAEQADEELSIMWFIGIDSSFYGTDNMPWYHEKYDRNSYYYTNNSNYNRSYKKKYFYEKEIVIETEEDLQKVQDMEAREIGIVRIQPRDDGLLRSKKFITNVGIICKRKNVNIFLEGAVLAHSFYQLISTGATVLCAHEIREFEEKIEYNKLVRDLIPSIIRSRGERVKCVSIRGIGLIREIKNKLIEESYEVLGATGKNEIIEELADLEEVCDSLQKNIELIIADKDGMSRIGEIKNKIAFDAAVYEKDKQKGWINIENLNVYVTMERQKCDLQVDFILGHAGKETNYNKPETQCNKYRRDILMTAFKIWDCYDIAECNLLLKEIRKYSRRLLAESICEVKEFEYYKMQKQKDKGGFEKGYILIETAFGNKCHETLKDIDLIGEPVEISELKRKTDRIDVDDIAGNRLLIRLRFPIYSRRQEWMIRKSRIRDYLHRDVKIKISRQLNKTEICFGMEFLYDNYEQLQLNLD